MAKDNRLRIGVDLDGVLFDWTSSFSRLCEGLYGREFPKFGTGWNLPNFNLTPDEFKRAWDTMCADSFFYVDLRPFVDVASLALSAFDKEYRLYFVTSRPWVAGDPIEIQSARSLRDNFGITYPTVIVTENKGATAAALGLTDFIDDKPENLADIRKHSPVTRLYLRNWLYNQSADIESVLPLGSYERVASFTQFLLLVGSVTQLAIGARS